MQLHQALQHFLDYPLTKKEAATIITDFTLDQLIDILDTAEKEKKQDAPVVTQRVSRVSQSNGPKRGPKKEKENSKQVREEEDIQEEEIAVNLKKHSRNAQLDDNFFSDLLQDCGATCPQNKRPKTTKKGKTTKKDDATWAAEMDVEALSAEQALVAEDERDSSSSDSSSDSSSSDSDSSDSSSDSSSERSSDSSDSSADSSSDSSSG